MTTPDTPASDDLVNVIKIDRSAGVETPGAWVDALLSRIAAERTRADRAEAEVARLREALEVERETCARIADATHEASHHAAYDNRYEVDSHALGKSEGAKEIAAAIRARAALATQEPGETGGDQ